jgi:succinate dehydrogenase/fumarate reductase iron-sulfur protein
MQQKEINVKVFRFNPTIDKEPHYKVYKVPLMEGISVLDVLDYIYENIDGSIAYYDHAACRHGICGGCMLIVNGKPCLACQTPVSGDITIEPINPKRVIRDLVCAKG